MADGHRSDKFNACYRHKGALEVGPLDPDVCSLVPWEPARLCPEKSTWCLEKPWESLRHKLLVKALARHPDRQTGPVTVYKNVVDVKVADRWLLTCPSRDLGMSCHVFQEGLSAHFCLPSPAIRDGAWVGMPVGTGGEVIDKFGNKVMCSSEICGDTFRRRHDTVKKLIKTECL